MFSFKKFWSYCWGTAACHGETLRQVTGERNKEPMGAGEVVGLMEEEREGTKSLGCSEDPFEKLGLISQVKVLCCWPELMGSRRIK